jgi:hypothetical protein
LNGQTAKDAEVPLNAYELTHTQDKLPKQGNTSAILKLSSLFGVQSRVDGHVALVATVETNNMGNIGNVKII